MNESLKVMLVLALAVLLGNFLFELIKMAVYFAFVR